MIGSSYISFLFLFITVRSMFLSIVVCSIDPSALARLRMRDLGTYPKQWRHSRNILLLSMYMFICMLFIKGWLTDIGEV